MFDKRGNSFSACLWVIQHLACACMIYCLYAGVELFAGITRFMWFSRGIFWAGESESDRVPPKYSLTRLWKLSFLLHFCLSPLSCSFLFPWHANSSKYTRTGMFLVLKLCSNLASAERGLWCVESVGLPVWSGFHLWNASWVRFRVLSVPRLHWNQDRLSKRLRTQCCLSVCLSVCLVFHRHVVSSVTPPTPTPLHQYLPNCPHTVNHFLPARAAYLSMCFYLWSYNCSFLKHYMNHYKQSGAGAIMSFMSKQNMNKQVGAVNDPTCSNQVIRRYSVIFCNHKTCQARSFSCSGSRRPCQSHRGIPVRCD